MYISDDGKLGMSQEEHPHERNDAEDYNMFIVELMTEDDDVEACNVGTAYDGEIQNIN